ncbi:hypothetical protein AVEN_72235-1 [Araneus ventricosus]|uniref:Uncharacterized protein n=1 Tax=Araneus ventricosus TaxID=182803 RepID=A0A4Y2LYZ1_ARAVE|nr:hypothetical protein AVEN_72235-1 [Araneus ventricosus]
MAADSFHHQVELAMKHSRMVYDFQDFVQCVQQANSGKVDTKELGVGDVFAWKDFISKQKHNLRGENIPYLTDDAKVTAKRGNTSLLYSTKYEESSSKVLNFLQAKCIKNFPMPEKNDEVRGFNKAKKKEIVEKLCPLMPSNCRPWILVEHPSVRRARLTKR